MASSSRASSEADEAESRHVSAAVESARTFMLLERQEEKRQKSLAKQGDSRYYMTDDDYALTRSEQNWLRTLFERYRQDPLNRDCLNELLWSVDRETMDKDQMDAKLRALFGATDDGWVTPTEGDATSLSAPDTEELAGGTSTARSRSFDSNHTPLTFQQLLDFASTVKARCLNRLSEQEQMTLDAFVLLGGEEDGSGEVRLDVLKRTIETFQLNIDVESFIAAVDKDGDGTISYDEFAWMYNEGLAAAAGGGATPTVSVVSSAVFGAPPAAEARRRSLVDTLRILHHGAGAVDHNLVSTTTSKGGAAHVYHNHSVSLVGGSVSIGAHPALGSSTHALASASKRLRVARVKPQPVRCTDLAEPEDVLVKLRDVLVTHGKRLAYIEAANIKTIHEMSNVFAPAHRHAEHHAAPSATSPTQSDDYSHASRLPPTPSGRPAGATPPESSLQAPTSAFGSSRVPHACGAPTVAELVTKHLTASLKRTDDSTRWESRRLVELRQAKKELDAEVDAQATLVAQLTDQLRQAAIRLDALRQRQSSASDGMRKESRRCRAQLLANELRRSQQPSRERSASQSTLHTRDDARAEEVANNLAQMDARCIEAAPAAQPPCNDVPEQYEEDFVAEENRGGSQLFVGTTVAAEGGSRAHSPSSQKSSSSVSKSTSRSTSRSVTPDSSASFEIASSEPSQSHDPPHPLDTTVVVRHDQHSGRPLDVSATQADHITSTVQAVAPSSKVQLPVSLKAPPKRLETDRARHTKKTAAARSTAAKQPTAPAVSHRPASAQSRFVRRFDDTYMSHMQHQGTKTVSVTPRAVAAALKESSAGVLGRGGDNVDELLMDKWTRQ